MWTNPDSWPQDWSRVHSHNEDSLLREVWSVQLFVKNCDEPQSKEDWRASPSWKSRLSYATAIRAQLTEISGTKNEQSSCQFETFWRSSEQWFNNYRTRSLNSLMFFLLAETFNEDLFSERISQKNWRNQSNSNTFWVLNFRNTHIIRCSIIPIYYFFN